MILEILPFNLQKKLNSYNRIDVIEEVEESWPPEMYSAKSVV